MKKIMFFCLLGASALIVNAQTKPAAEPTIQEYGKIDKADLELKACDFEKDANAEVLFDKADVYYDRNFNIVMERHKRIKIFNDNGKESANIRLEFFNADHFENISNVQAETINLVDGKPEITKIDKKLIYTQNIDKQRSAIVFTMPNVRAGSVIEFKYVWQTNSYGNFPDWFFQGKIPTRYSELETGIPEYLEFALVSKVRQPYVKDITSTDSETLPGGDGQNNTTLFTVNKRTRGLANIKSLPDEAYMSSDVDNLQCLLFHLSVVKPIGGGFSQTRADTWAKLGGILADDDDFGAQLKKKLTNEDAIISKAKTLKTNAEKIAYIFNEVKNTMKWDGNDEWYTNDGTSKAWDRKSGNSAEVNLILYHLLNASGVRAYPMVVSTRDHGKVYPAFTFLYQFNRAVVYIPVDSTKRYILDATNKYNIYTETPDNLLNSYGLYIDKENKVFDLIFLKRDLPVRQLTLINAEIKADGKMSGTTQISSPAYARVNSIKRYKDDGEKKYVDYLRDNDNNLNISAIKFDNMDDDTAPLIQNIDFTLDLTSSDGNYIYFNPNLFTGLYSNPFLSEERLTDIDFGYLKDYIINGSYKIPAGYKVDALPKNTTMTLPDKSISFKRIVAEQDGNVVVSYTISHKKSIYFKEDYPYFHDFYKKMHELLNEQIVLKKS